MSTNRLQPRGQSGTPTGSSNNVGPTHQQTPTNMTVDHQELNSVIDTLLEVRHHIKQDAPDFGIKPVNLEERQIEMLIEKSQ